MATPAEKLDAMLKDFETRTKTDTDNPGANLRALLDKSPDLKARVLDSIDKGYLEKFNPLPPNTGAGGSYSGDSKSIQLPMDKLGQAAANKGQAAELVFVMGHEIQHSFNRDFSTKTREAFDKAAADVAKGPSPHDYTAAVKGYVEGYRKNEASAHIGGFNALVSQVQQDNPKATLKDIYNAHPGRMQDFIQVSGEGVNRKYELKPGLTVDKNLHMPETEQNVASMGKYYFDKPKTPGNGFGPEKDQNYSNYYGDSALRRLEALEKRVNDAALKADPKHVPAEVKLDLKALNMDRAVLNSGLTFTDSRPTRARGPSAPVTEPTDANPSRKRDADGASIPDPTNARPQKQRGVDAPVDGANAPLYTQAVAALEKLGPASGIRSREELQAVAATMAVRAQGDGLERIDTIVKSTNRDGLFAVQGDLASPGAMRSYVDRADAAQQSPEANLARLQTPAPVLTPEPQQPALAGPAR
jgi:hypothetical protein